MRLFHGTSALYEQSIRTRGLLPSRDDTAVRSRVCCWLTEDRDVAIAYAASRVLTLRVQGDMSADAARGLLVEVDVDSKRLRRRGVLDIDPAGRPMAPDQHLERWVIGGIHPSKIISMTRCDVSSLLPLAAWQSLRIGLAFRP